jgi:hypothetical protein
MATNKGNGSGIQPVEVEDDFERFEAEARAKAAKSAADGAISGRGTVVNGDPRMRYAILDGDLPAKYLNLPISELIASGYRRVDKEVLGYTNPIVHEIPWSVHRIHIFNARLARAAEDEKRQPRHVSRRQSQLVQPYTE